MGRREAAREATAAGKPIPTATAPKAEQRREQAERAVPAAEWLAREAQDRYLAAVRQHGDAIDKAAAETEAALATSLASRLDQVEEALLRLGELRVMRNELRVPPAGKHPVFDVRTPRKLAGDLAVPIQTLPARLGGHP